jgi:hypothetical protein
VWMTGSCGVSCSGDTVSVLRALGILWRFERLAETATHRCTSRNMSSADKTVPACTPVDELIEGKQASTAQKPRSGATQSKFVTPAAKRSGDAHSEIVCPRFGHVIPKGTLVQALESGNKIVSYFAGGLNSADAASSTPGSNSKANVTGYTHEQLQTAVYHPPTPANLWKTSSKPVKLQSIHIQSSASEDEVEVVQSHTQSPQNPSSKSKAKASKVAAKPRAQPAKSSPKRNSKEWNLDQTIALLTEIVDGETYLNVEVTKGKKKYEERKLVSRAKGIPHGYTNDFWDAIIDKLQSSSWSVTVGENKMPLFPLALKTKYVSAHFDKLVNKKLDQKAKKRGSAGPRSFGVNDDDFETGEGDDSQDEGKGEDSATDSDGNKKIKKKSKLEQIDELLEAYFIQQEAHKNEVEASLFVVAVDDQSDDHPKAGSKRKSGQENEHLDQELIEDAANGNRKKKEKLPKLPMPTHVERSQAQSYEHASKMSSGFQALADSQKPSSVEDFKQKSAALVDQIGNTVGATVTQAIDAWSKYKSSARACVSGHELHDWLTLREEPLRMVCKRCGNVIG